MTEGLNKSTIEKKFNFENKKAFKEISEQMPKMTQTLNKYGFYIRDFGFKKSTSGGCRLGSIPSGPNENKIKSSILAIKVVYCLSGNKKSKNSFSNFYCGYWCICYM